MKIDGSLEVELVWGDGHVDRVAAQYVTLLEDDTGERVNLADFARNYAALVEAVQAWARADTPKLCREAWRVIEAALAEARRLAGEAK